MKRLVSTLSAACVVFACGSDTAGPAMQEAAGSYHAVTLKLEDVNGITDWLALGASIDLTLTPTGGTSGQMFIPGGNPDGTDFTADLTGTWSREGALVRMAHPSDSFLKDIAFVYSAQTLHGWRSTGGNAIEVELSR